MRRNQADRSVIARRAGASTSTASGTVATNPARRTSTHVYATGRIVKTHAAKMTPLQRNAEGRPSEWNRSAHYWTDPKWGRVKADG